MTELPEDIYAPTARPVPNGRSVLLLTADKVHDLEFFYPYYRFIEEGFHVDVVTPKGKGFEGKMGMGLKETKAIAGVAPDSYDLLYIPGGKAPSELKKNEDALTLVRRFVQAGKPVAAICHGPQVLAAAGVISDRRIAAWPEVQKEVEAAGAVYVNEATFADAQFITARWPGDLPAHVAASLQAIRKNDARGMKPGMPQVA